VIRISAGARTPAVDARLAQLDQLRFSVRLWRKDDTLWGDDPEHRRVAANRLGWLEVADRMRGEVESLQSFASKAAGDGFTHAVLLGMGGSSLAPEVLRLTLGSAKAGSGGAAALELTVLDNTSPAAVRAVAGTHDPRRTLFIVSSKSGGTIEVASFEKYFFDWVRAARGEEAGRSFAAITDPDTLLEQLARSRGYRRAFINPPDIGGRYSALSFFGLVPAALIGADLDALLEGAAAEAKACAATVPLSENPAVVLGAALGELALSGRNKLTLVLPSRFAALGSWIEQLVAESTGKLGRGIIPITEESLATPEYYGRDRVFVAIEPEPLDPDDEARLLALESAGQPVIRWSHGEKPSARHDASALARALGAEFLRWEIATATAGAVLAVDPFDEPNVSEAKQATQGVLEGWLESGRFESPSPFARAGDVQVFAPTDLSPRLREAGSAGPHAAAAALLGLAQSGDYFAVLAYMHRTRERHTRLQRLRHVVRDDMRLATTLGYGPRFLHSTGQLHKGGANNGVFLQLTCDEGEELPIPGERFGFGTLRQAQAAGDYEVLERRKRRVVRVHLGARVETALDELIAAFENRRS
jgi:glucose-6-phosphate isomerase